MTRTPDEIKKGLDCCADGNLVCAGNCVFDDDAKLGFPDCVKLLMTNALALIQQLQADNAQLNRCIENMTDKLNAANDEMAKLQAARDAAVEDLKTCVTEAAIGDGFDCCFACKYNNKNGGCDRPHTTIECCGIEDFDNKWQWRGVQKEDGVQISEVVGAGRYTALNWYADLTSIDISAKQVKLVIDDVSTSDKQTVSVEILAEVARKSDEESVRTLWENYNAVAKRDEQLIALVQDLMRSPVNKVSTTMTVDEMLGVDETSEKTRATMEQDIAELLRPVLETRGIALNTLNVMNVGVDPQYQAKLQEKSTAAIEIELAEQKAKQLEKQLEQEKAQTEIDLEKARRANLVAEEEAKVYQESAEAYELKRLELLQGMLDDSDKVYFIPEGADITLFLGGEGVVPAK